MADDIKIGIATDTRAFEQGMSRGVLKPLEDVEKELEKVSTGGDQAGDDIERGMRSAQDATEKFRREIKEGTDALDAQGRAAKYAGDDTKRAMQDSTNAGKANVQELGNEAKANLAETLSSFDGSVEGFIGGIQGTLGGVTAGLSGALPLIVAAAGAAGLGLLYTAFQSNTEAAQRVKEKVGELSGELLETGSIGKRSMDGMVDALKQMTSETDDAETSLSELSKATDRAQTSFDKTAQAYVGNSDALKDLIGANEELAQKYREQLAMADPLDVADNDKIARKVEGINQLNGMLEKQLPIVLEAEKAARLYAESGAPELERKAELIAAIDTAYDDAAGAVEDYIDKESGVFDVQGFIDSMNRREEALRNFQETLATSALSSEAKAFLVSQGEESASKFLQGYQAATPAQQAELNRIWSEGGRTSSGAYTRELKAGIPGSIPGPTVNGRVDMDRTELDKVLRGTYSVIVNTITKIGSKNP